jgi:hypothetical protein
VALYIYKRTDHVSHSKSQVMGLPENIFSYCVGGLALLSTIFSMLFFCRLYLPATQLKLLDELLAEMKDMHKKTHQEGLLNHTVYSRVQTRLRRSVHMLHQYIGTTGTQLEIGAKKRRTNSESLSIEVDHTSMSSVRCSLDKLANS